MNMFLPFILHGFASFLCGQKQIKHLGSEHLSKNVKEFNRYKHYIAIQYNSLELV